MPAYIEENNEIILRAKDDIYKIVNAFLQSGIDLDVEVFPALKHKSLYLEGESD